MEQPRDQQQLEQVRADAIEAQSKIKTLLDRKARVVNPHADSTLLATFYICMHKGADFSFLLRFP